MVLASHRDILKTAGPLIPAGAVALPLLVVLLSFTAPADEATAHVWTTTGPLYLMNTLALAAIVGAGSVFLGAFSAALVSIAEFPGRRAVSIALVLPLAVPAYIAAYSWGDLFGPFGAGTAFFGGALDMKSFWGAAVVLTFANYPYVYLAARASFEARSGAFLEAARMLGASPLRFVLRVLAPAGRAAIAGGLALALMETVADYGVADYTGVPTLSVGIFRTWRGLGDLTAASQLAGGLLLVALLLVMMEDFSRRGLAAESARGARARARLHFEPLVGVLAAAACAAPILLGFVVPVLTLGTKLVGGASTRGLLNDAANTAFAASVGALLAVAFASVLVLSARGGGRPLHRLVIRAATLGYAVPGAVVAAAIVSAAALVGAPVAAGLLTLIYAYVVRFSTAAFNAIDAGLKQIHPSSEDAARMLGASLPRIATTIFLPAARPAVAAGALIVFIDICRELPATLLLRPFNFETLATQVYRLASDERLAEAAPAALILILLSIAPTLLLSRFGESAEKEIRR